MQATLFEFCHRWWVIFSVFFLAFAAYTIDPVNCGRAIADAFAQWRGGQATREDYRLLFGFGALLVAASAFWRTWGTSYLHADVMRDSKVRTEKLTADGPYRRMRNPLYFGNLFVAAGIGLMASRTGFVILTTDMTVFVLRLILREEAELRAHQGESYLRYCGAVPRLLPSIRPRVPREGASPNWGQALRAESMYWLLAVAMGVFAATLNIRVFWTLLATAMTAAFIAKRPESRPESSQ